LCFVSVTTYCDRLRIQFSVRFSHTGMGRFKPSMPGRGFLAMYRIVTMGSAKPENHIDYIELPASDIAKTKAFYGSVFGWTFTDYGPDYTSFHDGRMAGGFTKESPAPGKGILLVIYSTDLDAAQQRIKTAGGRIVKDTFAFPGGRRFHFSDPNGNELAVWSE
jgi:uncharacterized protein